jgi:hypothetical protein
MKGYELSKNNNFNTLKINKIFFQKIRIFFLYINMYVCSYNMNCYKEIRNAILSINIMKIVMNYVVTAKLNNIIDHMLVKSLFDFIIRFVY